jgi:hypothetical protein
VAHCLMCAPAHTTQAYGMPLRTCAPRVARQVPTQVLGPSAVRVSAVARAHECLFKGLIRLSRCQLTGPVD